MSITTENVGKKKQIELSVKNLKEDKTSGLNVEEMASKYSLKPSQMKKALKEAGIPVRAKQKPAFVLINDDVNA